MKDLDAAIRTVAELAQADTALDVPEYAVRGAKAIGCLKRRGDTAASPSILRRLGFTVAFDSLSHPAPAGTRTLSSSDRQLVFEAPPFTVGVRLEHEVDPPATVLVGELLEIDRDSPSAAPRPIPEVPVLILAGDRIVSRSLTGRFGEFQAEDLPRDPLAGDSLRLCLLVGQEECLFLPLGRS